MTDWSRVTPGEFVAGLIGRDGKESIEGCGNTVGQGALYALKNFKDFLLACKLAGSMLTSLCKLTSKVAASQDMLRAFLKESIKGTLYPLQKFKDVFPWLQVSLQHAYKLMQANFISLLQAQDMSWSFLKLEAAYSSITISLLF